MTMQTDSSRKQHLPIAGQKELDIDAELACFEAEERARLGLEAEERWIENMANLGFTKSEKAKITLLVGGLTMAHDFLIEGALSNLGYNVLSMDAPDNDALRVGKEFGNRAQCNPTYFTVGNLVKYLIHLRDEKGMTTQEIVDKFVLLTAGACGPCRFGMYVTEYRKALRDAGFDGFRVMLFQQQGGLSQASGEESGLELKTPFFLALIKAVVAGDVLNGLGYRIRPFEIVPGSADKAIEKAKRICYDALANGKSILGALWRAKKEFAGIEVDRLQPKPRTAIIGEFWAMTTEGDGNYALQKFLQREGSECDIQFVTAWLLYNIWEVRFDMQSRASLRDAGKANDDLANMSDYGVFVRRAGLVLADKLVRAVFQTFAHAGGFYDYPLPDMDQIAALAAPYYNNDVRGGEGHMEVAKLILNVARSKASMTLSVKPFGCMPSSGVSDGVQSLITEKFPGSIYCAVETSGDGAVSFYSRVQMYLFKAKQAAQVEFDKALSDAGLTLEQVRGFIREHPRYGHALHRAPHTAASTAGDLINEIASVYGKPAWKVALGKMQAIAGRVTSAGRTAVVITPPALKSAAGVTAQSVVELAGIAKERVLKRESTINIAAAAG